MSELNPLKARLAAGLVSTSMVVRYSRSVEVALVAKAAGFDSLYVDVEHAPLSLDQTSQICVTARAAGVTPLVRVPAGRLDLVGRALDGGALGVIVPHVTTVEDARRAVSAARFPPHGTRSAAGAAIQLDYGPVAAGEANARLNDATLVALMIESADAVAAVADLAAVPGVDLLLVGANDLLGDLGVPGQYEHDKLAEAYAAVLDAGRRHGVPVGVGGLATRLDLARRYVERGARYVSVGTDIAFLLRGARAARAELGGAPA
ncbi:aldolase/citrate lyase family protein [Dactylosporangium sp. AC04546]|uniref:HpcH/HpaI aldolase family protein n=1 Tax=Dactylosporangium sp. AC04546 TaxID=2862460 RepID=UPI001EE11159|nr:aldolase/citrate lyase family protein [Dactylosporangium sp. AC04546]WVK79524.1 aldolase/citrate lyase family protein [Dactylosporangium sp. AC04546]